jgi:hypothetical protein
MTADIENSLVVLRMPDQVRELLGVRPQRGLLLVEARGDDVVFGGFDGAGIERRFAASGGCDVDVEFVFEGLNGVREFGLCGC